MILILQVLFAIAVTASAEANAKEIIPQAAPVGAQQQEVGFPSIEETINAGTEATGMEERNPESNDSYNQLLQTLNADHRRNQRRVAAFNLVTVLAPTALTI